MSITDPYVQSKQHKSYVKLTSIEQVQREDGITPRQPKPKKRVCTDKCNRDYGFCFPAYFQEQRERRKGVWMCDAKTRKRTRNNARRKG